MGANGWLKGIDARPDPRFPARAGGEGSDSNQREPLISRSCIRSTAPPRFLPRGASSRPRAGRGDRSRASPLGFDEVKKEKFSGTRGDSSPAMNKRPRIRGPHLWDAFLRRGLADHRLVTGERTSGRALRQNNRVSRAEYPCSLISATAPRGGRSCCTGRRRRRRTEPRRPAPRLRFRAGQPPE